MYVFSAPTNSFSLHTTRYKFHLYLLMYVCVCVKVNPGSVAECHGLKAGDAVLQINSRSSDELEHEQAKQEIVASGNSVTLVLQRYLLVLLLSKRHSITLTT